MQLNNKVIRFNQLKQDASLTYMGSSKPTNKCLIHRKIVIKHSNNLRRTLLNFNAEYKDPNQN